MRSPHIPWLLLALLVLLGATSDHPNHPVQLDRIKVNATDNGRYLGIVAAKVQPVDGVGVPTFVTNASLQPVAGLPSITRDPITGILTLPSVPSPATSLRLYAGGVRQSWGRDFTVNGNLITPGPDVTVNGQIYSPKGVILDAIEIIADWQR